MNLNNGGSNGVPAGTVAYSVTTAGVSTTTPPAPRNFSTGTSTVRGVRQNQDWVIVSMFAEGRFSVDFDAAWLGNGCSPSPIVTGPNTTNPIGPAPNVTP